jgi:hypothetical protein
MVLTAKPVEDVAPQSRERLSPRIASLEADGCFELTAASSQRAVLSCLQQLRMSVVLSLKGARVPGTVMAARDLALSISLEHPVSDGECVMTCEMYGVQFVFRGPLQRVRNADPAGGSVVLWSEPRIYVRNRRRETRVSLKSGEGTLRWARVVDGAPKVVESSIVDLAPRGARVQLRETDPPPPQSPFVAELRLGNVRVPMMADVQGASHSKSTELVGLHLSSGVGHAALVHAYLKRRFPRLIARKEVNHEILASLLRDSGYLNLRAGEGPSTSWAEFAAAYSVDVVYQAEDGKLLGHISVTRIYSSTWVFHQLATLGGHRESGVCRKTLYDLVSSVPTAFDGSAAHALAYFNLERRWHQLLFSEFIDWLDDPRLGVAFTWDRFEHSARASSEPECSGSDYIVEPLRDEDLLPATALIREQLPRVLADALDIRPQDLTSTALNGASVRTRTALCLRLGNELVGVALCETGPAGGSLFNLFNIAQFYFCATSPGLKVHGQLALLKAVRRLYQQRGVHDPIVVAPTGTFAAASESGTELAERMGCIALSSEGVRHWEGYCRFRMGQLYLRKTGQRRIMKAKENANVANRD